MAAHRHQPMHWDPALHAANAAFVPALGAAVVLRAADGGWTADYVRPRFAAHLPEPDCHALPAPV